MRRTIPLGLLCSGTGSSARIARACRTGAPGAIAGINAGPAQAIAFAPQHRDPGGDIDRCAPLCDDLPARAAARHIVGCVTSWSRKEVIPTLGKHGATLWYAVPCEGFEAADHVACLQACEARRGLAAEVDDLRRRLGERQTVVRAVRPLLRSTGSEQAALRAAATEARIPLEEAAGRILSRAAGPVPKGGAL